jgi:hypothetical protein
MRKNALDFHQLMRSISKRLQARVELSGVYAHPSGVGDDREYAVMDVLREVLPQRYGVDKGRVFDSEGRVSREIDLVIYERDELFLGLDVGGRKLIPVESVYAVIEVKSRLDKGSYAASERTLRSIEPLRRFYSWGNKLSHLTDENQTKVAKGVLATQLHLNIGVIWSSIVTFDAVSDKALARYLHDAPDHLVFVCMPGRRFVTKLITPHAGFRGLRVGDEALGLFTWGVLELLSTNTRKQYFTPNLSRYREGFVEDLGSMKAWTLKVGSSRSLAGGIRPSTGSRRRRKPRSRRT